MKRFIAIALCAVCALCLMGCGKTEDAAAYPLPATIRLVNGCDTELSGVSISYAVEGETLGSMGMTTADGEPFEPGALCDFTLGSEALPGDCTAVTIDVYASKESGVDYTLCGTMIIDTLNFGWTYETTITTDPDGSYALSPVRAANNF